MGTKNATNRMTVGKLLAILLAAALALTMVPTVAFAGTTGDDGAHYADSTVPDAPDCARVSWNGLIWDIIGYNYSGVKYGVAGDTAGTVTLLLDEESYDSTYMTAFDSTSPYSNVYAGSDLQVKLASICSGLGDTADIVHRDLEGGSGLSASDGSGTSTGAPYTGDTIAGSEANSQYLWSLSVTEASQLKASVRAYGHHWWLRSPGSSSSSAGFVYYDGNVNSSGYDVHSTYAARPALYLNLPSSIFTSLSDAISSGTLKTGAYSKTLKVTDSAGYTWDIVGVGGAVNRGVTTPSDYATLLLSNSSVKKFGFPNQSYVGTTYGYYDLASPWSNEYAGSDLKSALASAYNTIKGKAEYGNNVKLRNLEGGATYNDGSEKVAGATVESQGLWPLSVTEVEALSNQERIFGYSWWLRSPGYSSDYAGFVNHVGDVFSGGNSVGYTYAARPALYLNLSSSIFASLPSGWQERVGSTYNDSVVKRTVTFNPNGGAVSFTTKTVDNNTAIGTLPVPTRANYSFDGWYKAKTGGAKISASTVITANTTYYAHWQAVKPKAGAPSAIVNHVDFKKHVKITTPTKKSVKKKKSASIKLTAFKNVAVKSIKLDKAAKKLKLKVTKAKNSIKVKAGSKKGKGKITVTLKNGNKKTITVTIK